MSRALVRKERFDELIADDNLPEMLVQRVATGRTTRQIAKELDVSHLLLMGWVAKQAGLNEQLLRVREAIGHDLRMEGLEIIDSAKMDDLWVKKEQAAYRERLSKAFAPNTYGDKLKIDKQVSVEVSADMLRTAEELLALVRVPEITLKDVQDAEQIPQD